MSPTHEPTLLGLPLEIRLAIWELTKWKGMLLDFHKDYLERGFARGSFDEYGEYVGYSRLMLQAVALLLVNRQIYEEILPTYHSKTRTTLNPCTLDLGQMSY
jgi:hypothetical protein